MDNNNPVNPNPVPMPNINPPQTQQSPNIPPNPPVSGEPPPKSSKKMILMLVASLVIAVVLVGGAYFYVNSQGARQKQIQTPPLPKTQDVLDTELNKVNVEDLETEFATVEADLQNL